MRYKIFISSVQNEFTAERRQLADYLRKDSLFSKFFDVFIFEDTPAKDYLPEKVYIEEVKKSDIFILLLGKEYGYEFEDGTSPTEREFQVATKGNKYRLVFLSNIKKAKRNFPLTMEDGKEKILTHLNLLNKGKITNAAILLFGFQPQRFFLTSEVKCAHFHGTRVEKPIPFYQVYKGNLFELVDQAVDFVLSKIDLAVGTRAKSVEVPTAYEIPKEVIQEAIVNAVAHRDYDSTASVQVMLFRDRLEIRNPGQLPAELPVENLTKDHTSYPRNPLIADALYYTKYIERMGTGIQDIVKQCKNYGLPKPKFEMQDGFVVIIYRKQGLAFEKVVEGSGQANNVTENRMQHILELILTDNTISTNQLSEKLGVTRMTVHRDLDKLKANSSIERIGPNKGGYWRIIKK